MNFYARTHAHTYKQINDKTSKRNHTHIVRVCMCLKFGNDAASSIILFSFFHFNFAIYYIPEREKKTEKKSYGTWNWKKEIGNQL